MSNLTSIDTSRTEQVVEHVEELLDRCKAGEVVAVTVIEEHLDNTYRVHGSASPSRFATAGMLLEASISRLNSS
ncbi:hypothetical protein KAI46_03945 [bacterium]|nr:hypothetical protein [bacterium]